MSRNDPVASLGAGVIGASWTSLFLARGREVRVYDPAPDASARLADYVKEAWPVLERLGLVAADADPGRYTFFRSAAEAVTGASFIQESIPEQRALKHALYQEVEPALAPGAILATSASGLTLTELQGGWSNPARFVLGHPFNPPHLIPLVEVMGNAKTDPDAISGAEKVYEALGKVTIRLNREVPGHVANRLQAAVWREAIHLVAEGVASVGDIDKAIWAGPGLRWAAMGPTTLFHLAAGEDGLAAFCDRYAESFHRWWDDLGTPALDAPTARTLVNGLSEATGTLTVDEIARRRDALIVAMLIATNGLDRA
jgi:3-hydroxybutyryl-CoA dehydrogenase